MKFLVSLLSSLIFGLFWFTTLFAQDQSLIRHSVIPATEEHDTIKFGVMIPPSYQDNGKRYPVIYYLHGSNGQYSGWQAHMVAEFFTEHSLNRDIPECIIVFPDGREGLWWNHYDGDPLLEKEVIDILIPHIGLNYPVDVEKQLIMGWSAGGAGTMNFFSKHPALFKACISLD